MPVGDEGRRRARAIGFVRVAVAACLVAACGQPSSRTAERRARMAELAASTGETAGMPVDEPATPRSASEERRAADDRGDAAEAGGDVVAKGVREEAAVAVVSAGFGASGPRSAADLDAPGEREGEDGEREPSIVTPLPELCRQACANARRLVELELPSDTAPAMREEIERALARDCPGRCLQRASMESARCIATAKSALELAACQ